MTEYRRLRNDLMRNRLAGVETPAQREQSLQRLINLALTLKKNADPGSPEEAQYDGDLRKYVFEMNRLQAGRKSAPTKPTPPLGAATPQGLPPGVPAGSKLLPETTKGKPIYLAPDGKKYVVE